MNKLVLCTEIAVHLLFVYLKSQGLTGMIHTKFSLSLRPSNPRLEMLSSLLGWRLSRNKSDGPAVAPYRDTVILTLMGKATS